MKEQVARKCRQLSPAARHFARASAVAEQEVEKAPDKSDQFQLTFAQLVEDRRRLHDIQSVEAKIKLKRELLPGYMPYVRGVIEGGNGAPNEIVSTIMIWLLDVGELGAAVEVGEYVIEFGLDMPDNYQRTAPAALAEEAADTVLRMDVKPTWEKGQIKNPRKKPAELPHLVKVAELTAECDMHDQIRAKLYKAIGYLHALNGDYGAAQGDFQDAVRLHGNIGVKKDIERLAPLVEKEAETKAKAEDDAQADEEQGA